MYSKHFILIINLHISHKPEINILSKSKIRAVQHTVSLRREKSALDTFLALPTIRKFTKYS